MATKLNPKQEAFCRAYVSDEFFANGVQSYIETYQPDQSKRGWYKSACACSSRLLANAKVSARINELLDAAGLNDTFVDKQTLFLITQHADFNAKLGAIREYNKLKKRIEPPKNETNLNFNLGNLDDAQLRALASGTAGSGKRRASTPKK